MTENTAGGNAGPITPTNRLELGGSEVLIEPPSGRKASTAFKILRGLEGVTSKLAKVRGAFRREFEEENVVELDRVQARMRFPARPIIGEDDVPVRGEDGELVYAPSIIDNMSEADWQEAGGKLRLPRSPDTLEELAAVLPVALDLAEDQVYRLLALFTISNADVARYRKEGALDDRLAERVDELLDDVMADDLLELAVVVVEVLTERFSAKLTALGGRTGKALAAIGLGGMTTTPATGSTTASTETETPSSDSTPTSPTDSPALTDGPPTQPSTRPMTSSSSSAPGSTETPSESDEPASERGSAPPAATPAAEEEAPAPA
jgi:hypothetical protein